MAILTADDWFASAEQLIKWRKTAAATTIAAQPFSTWDLAGNPGAGSLTVGNTAAGIVPTDATAGAPAINAFGGGAKGYLAAGKYRGSVGGGLMLYDRLYHAGSVLMNALATTTFAAQPSYSGRLPAGPNYTGLEIFLEVNAAVSATATTVNVTYTNENGVAGRTTGATATLASMTTRRVIPMPLQAGDRGVQLIQSVTVGGVVATTGSFNVIVARQLAEFDSRLANALDAQGWDLIGAPEIFDNSCLWGIATADSTSSGLPSALLSIRNG